MSFESAYAVVAQKHKLPACDALAVELDLAACEGESFVLRRVRQAMEERVGVWLDVLEEVLNPDQASAASIYESHFFSDSERNEMFLLYKRLMRHDRALLEASVLSDEKADAQAIRSVWAEWQALKKEIVAVVGKKRGCWNKDVTRDEYVGYLG